VLARARRRDLRLQPTTAEPLQRYYVTKAHAHRQAGDRRRALSVLRRAAERFARAGLDVEPLLFELVVLRARVESLDRLPALHVRPRTRARRAAPAPRYTMDRRVYRRIVAACRGTHEERCGLLFGRGRRIERLRLLRNRSELPEISCESDPRQRRRLWVEERRAGRVLLAEFHSHTAGPARPSRADAVGPSRLLVIYSDVFDELRAWRVGRSYRHTLRSERGLRIEPPVHGRTGGATGD
jgi:proteasome lid subunit RPN8/RPN11